MITCAKCGNAVDKQDAVQKTDKEVFLEFWTPTLGAEEAQKSWEAKASMIKRQAPMVQSDIQGYISQVDGSWIDSKSKHRDHLKRHRMVEVGTEVQTTQKSVEIQNTEQRKRAIAEQVYSKLRY